MKLGKYFSNRNVVRMMLVTVGAVSFGWCHFLAAGYYTNYSINARATTPQVGGNFKIFCTSGNGPEASVAVYFANNYLFSMNPSNSNPYMTQVVYGVGGPADGNPVVVGAYFGNLNATTIYSSYPLAQDSATNGLLNINLDKQLLSDDQADRTLLAAGGSNTQRSSFPLWYKNQQKIQDSKFNAQGISNDKGYSFRQILTNNVGNYGNVGGIDKGFIGNWYCWTYFNRLFGDPAYGRAKNMVIFYMIPVNGIACGLYYINISDTGIIPPLTMQTGIWICSFSRSLVTSPVRSPSRTSSGGSMLALASAR